MRRARESLAGYGAPVVLCDVNMLVAASRSDHLHHALARATLDAWFASNGAFALSNQIMAAVVRIVSNQRIFAAPTPVDEAFALVERYAGYPVARPIAPGPAHWRLFRELVLATGLSGGATSDAWFAALAIEHGCEFWTFDRDFARFPGLRLRNLLA